MENLWNVYSTSFFKQNLLKNYKPAPMRRTERTDYRNGIRPKIHTTRIGKLKMEVSRHRYNVFHSSMLDNYQRNE